MAENKAFATLHVTVAVAVSLLLSLTLVFAAASAGWVASRSSEVQDVADAAALALDLTHQALRLTLAGGEPLRYGLRFEQVLPEYWERLGRQGE